MKRNKILEYITEKKYYLSLLGSLAIILIAVGVIYYNNQQHEEIANLNENIQKEDLVDNSLDELYQEKKDIIDASAPQITIHDEEVIPDTLEEDEAKEEAVNEGDQELQAENKVEEESNMIEVVPVIKVQQPNLTFSKSEGMIMPTTGQTIIPYNETVPVYLKTLDQYRINKGLYIGAEVGAEVKSVADGIVEEIKYEADRGNKITIYHGNGYETVYAQLKDDMNVKEGDLVDKGTIIGYVSEPTKYYKLEGTHLFFEILENDNPVNPADFIK